MLEIFRNLATRPNPNLELTLKITNYANRSILVLKQSLDIAMNMKLMSAVVFIVTPLTAFAVDSLYCPQNHAYIHIGMTTNQVIAACGQPLTSQDSNQAFTVKIPVQQLVYNNKGTETPFVLYNYSLTAGSGGARLEFDLINNVVRAIRLNGSDNNAASICEGTPIQIGDPIGKVYGSCGSPSIVNNTFMNQIVPTAQKPKVWIYQPGQYQPTVSLTFVDGKLQSIN